MVELLDHSSVAEMFCYIIYASQAKKELLVNVAACWGISEPCWHVGVTSIHGIPHFSQVVSDLSWDGVRQ